jgi:histidine ammonia-lyase
MASAGWAEEARAAAQPSLIGLGPVGRTDTSTTEVLAWRRCRDAADALEANLAVLAVVAAHTIAHRAGAVPPALRGLHDAVLSHLPLSARPADFSTGLSRTREHLRGLTDE